METQYTFKRPRSGGDFGNDEVLSQGQQSMDGSGAVPSYNQVLTRSLNSSITSVRQNASFTTIQDSDVVIGKEERGPTIRFAPHIKEQLIKPWQNALIVKLLGARHTYNYFNLKLRQKWSMLKGHWSILDIANDYYIVNFDSEADRQYVLTEGPWLITGRYLAIQKWEPGFQTEKDNITKLTVWLRISALHAEWFNYQVLHRIGALLGITHKVDMRAVTYSRGQYARICVELDLTKPLETEIRVDDIWYQIQYEGLHLVCFHCGIFGHDKQECPRFKTVPCAPTTSIVEGSSCSAVTTSSGANNADDTSSKKHDIGFGQWNLVQPRRQRKPTNKGQLVQQSAMIKSGSRFEVLQNSENQEMQANVGSVQNSLQTKEVGSSEQATPGQPNNTSSRRIVRRPVASKNARGQKPKEADVAKGGPRIQTNAAPMIWQQVSTANSRLEKGVECTAPVQIGNQAEHDLTHFPIPQVFAFNVAKEIPAAVLEAKANIPPEPPDAGDIVMPECKSNEHNNRSLEADMVNAEEAFTNSNMKELSAPPLTTNI